MPRSNHSTLPRIYQRLFKKFGPQYWWPAKTRFEVMAGAILTQNTNWGNVEKALVNLKKHRRLSSKGLKDISVEELAVLIKPAGYFNVKAKRLKSLVDFIYSEYNGDLTRMAQEPLDILRRKLLAVHGVGEETADSILLYAFDKPSFVVDAYTKRILSRHNLIPQGASYQDVQRFFVEGLKKDHRLFNEYHALIVRLGKDICRTKPHCEICPLKDVHYSLTKKCAVCHRAFRREEKYYRSGEKPASLICLSCRK